MGVERPTDLPDILFHYTDQHGLLGMTAAQNIRATHVHYLNDRREFELCLDLTRDHLIAHPGFRDSGLRGQLLQSFHDWVGRVDLPDIFVASFTAREDLLSQWRGYCSPGNGFCLGVDAARLLTSAYPFWRLSRCLYTQEEHDTAIRNYVEERLQQGVKYVDNFPDQDLTKSIDSKGFEFVANLMRLAPTLKDVSFSEEQEWRLISPPRTNGSPLDILFRPGRHTLIPFCEFKMPWMTDTHIEVIVGPTQQPRLSQHAVGSFLRARGFSDYSVRLSAVPYREW